MNIWRKTKEHDISITEIQSRIRGFIYDSQIPDAENIASFLGCSAISEELNEKEEEESDIRVERISKLIPILYAFSHAMSQGVVSYQVEDSKGEIPSAAWKATQKVFTQIATNTLVGAIAQLVDLGFLEVPRVNRKLRWKRTK